MKLIWNLKPGETFEIATVKYVRGNYADERSVYATRLNDGKQKTFQAHTKVEVS